MFRKATADDCRAVYDLICDMEAKELPYEEFADIFRGQLADARHYCLICEEDDGVAGDRKVMGMLNLRFERQLHHSSPIAEIMEFVVDSACRNRGVGAVIFSEACRIALERGCPQIEVACNQLRLDTHRFYERQGMKNYHYKFSMLLDGEDSGENALGR